MFKSDELVQVLAALDDRMSLLVRRRQAAASSADRAHDTAALEAVKRARDRVVAANQPGARPVVVHAPNLAGSPLEPLCGAAWPNRGSDGRPRALIDAGGDGGVTCPRCLEVR